MWSLFPLLIRRRGLLPLRRLIHEVMHYLKRSSLPKEPLEDEFIRHISPQSRLIQTSMTFALVLQMVATVLS